MKKGIGTIYHKCLNSYL